MIPFDSNSFSGPSQAKILIVDDTPANIEVLQRTLETQEFVISVATRGEAALEIIPRLMPDLILLDIMMPGMDGFETCRRLKNDDRFRDIPVIFISAKGDTQDIVEGFNQGGIDYIVKPIRSEEVLARVRTHLQLSYLKKMQVQRIQELELQARKLEELDQIRNRFFGIAMHDIRNPISSIRGFSDLYLMGEESFSDQEKKDLMEVIHQSSNDLLQMANDLLDISVFEAGKLSLTLISENLHPLLHKRIERNRILASKKNISIETEFEEVPSFLFDPNRIGQVVDNLIGNAIKFSQPETCVFVGLKSMEHIQEFFIRDQGPGIPEKDRKKLFTEFPDIGVYPTGGEKSTGLGLAIVKKIVDAHRGEIHVESREGYGTTFYVRLPLNGSLTVL